MKRRRMKSYKCAHPGCNRNLGWHTYCSKHRPKVTDAQRMAFADHVYAASEPDVEFAINLREKGKLDYIEGLEAEIEHQRDYED